MLWLLISVKKPNSSGYDNTSLNMRWRQERFSHNKSLNICPVTKYKKILIALKICSFRSDNKNDCRSMHLLKTEPRLSRVTYSSCTSRSSEPRDTFWTPLMVMSLPNCHHHISFIHMWGPILMGRLCKTIVMNRCHHHPLVSHYMFRKVGLAGKNKVLKNKFQPTLINAGTFHFRLLCKLAKESHVVHSPGRSTKTQQTVIMVNTLELTGLLCLPSSNQFGCQSAQPLSLYSTVRGLNSCSTAVKDTNMLSCNWDILFWNWSRPTEDPV